MKVFVAFIVFGMLTVSRVQEGEGGVFINEILADPPAGILGDANRDGVRSAFQDEFVELVNTDAVAVSLWGWTLSDSVELRHTFSSLSLIPANDFFVVFGGGNPVGFEAFETASTGSLSLNNSGDTVFLRDDAGTPVDFFTYGSEGGQDVSLSRIPDALGPFAKHTSASPFLFSPETTLNGEERLPDPDGNTVPEPASFILFGAGLLSLVRVKWKPFAAIFLMTLGCSTIAFGEANWEEVTNGIPESDFRTVTIDPHHGASVYVGTSKSVYKTVDGGKNWKNVLSIRGTLKAVHQIYITASGEIFSSTDGGLYHSSDGGESWEKLFGKRVLSIALQDVEGERTLFIGTGNGLFQSEDGGSQWERGGAELSSMEVNFLALHPEKNVLYAVSPRGVYASQDFGRRWERIFVTGTQAEDAETMDNGTDTGDADEVVRSTERVTAVAFKGDKILLGTKNGAYHSEDGGKSWSRLSPIGLGDSEINHLFVYQGVLYAATGKGIFSFSEEKENWKGASRGITEGRVTYLNGGSVTASLWATASKGIFKMREEESPRGEAQREAGEILARFAHEPSIEEIQEAAIRYAEVHPEKIVAWREAAARKAYLPTVSTGMDVDIDRNITVDSGGTTTPDFFIVGPDERGFNWDLTLTWDLGEILWNDDQTSIDVRSRLMVQLRDDVLDEVTRLYFERRRLQVALQIDPPKALKEKIEKELRLQELTADIDALTGRYLSRALQRNFL